MLTWASRIADLRATGLTLSQIAGRVGVHPSTIGDIASGRTTAPMGDAAVKLHKLHQRRCAMRRRPRRAPRLPRPRAVPADTS